jgi:DNA-directed RNA polymerase subunit H (RpoH/RPB5)
MASQNTSSLISQIYKSRTVLLDLLKQQGYTSSEYEGFSINEINTMKTNNQLDMILEKKIGGKPVEEGDISSEYETRKIYIKYYLAKALRPNNLQEMIDDLFTVEEVLTKKDTLMIVVKDEINETLSNTVPPHRVLSESEKINIKIRYNIIDDSHFPDISRFDPVAQAIGIRPGEVCEIIRPSKTAISAPYYRICN